MNGFWLLLGTIVLVAGFLDVFLTALNYDEAGFLATHLCVLEWHFLRTITRRMSRRWRPIALRQITGLQIMLSVMTWLGCDIVGFGLIYYGLMVGGSFQYDGRDLGKSLFSAIYLSAAQLATVGTSQISPETNLLRALTITETLSGLVLVSLILAFLLGVYQVVRDLRTLSANFFMAELEAGDAVASLAPYFREGQPVGIDNYLQAISDSFWSYADGLRLHHIAYYFQSGRDRFSLPYTLYMMGRTLAALRWGLPSNHAASAEPVLTRLIAQFASLGDYLQNELGWASTDVPAVIAFEDFSLAAGNTSTSPDVWVSRFLTLNRDMAQLAGLHPGEDLREAYERYSRWLPFAYNAEQMAAAVSRDLDYQPVFRADEKARVGDSDASGGSAEGSQPGATKRVLWRTLLARWVAVPDPGFTRLVTAAAATLAPVATVITLYPLFKVVHLQPLPATMFGGIVGMYAVTMPNDATASGRRLTTALIVIPAIAAMALGSAATSSFAIGIAVLPVIVLLGVWVGVFGPRQTALGQMAFMAYYYALVLHPHLALLPWFAVAAMVGAVWAYLFRFVFIAERPDRVLRGGFSAFRTRLVLMFNPLIDAASGARWDPDISNRTRVDLRQLHRCAAFLQGQLRAIDPIFTGLHTGELRLLLFDTELAADNVVAAVRQVARTGTAIPLVLRGQLAGMLEWAQDSLRHEAPPEDDLHPPKSWPDAALRLHQAARELLDSARSLHGARTELDHPRTAAAEIATETSSQTPQSNPAAEKRASAEGYRLLTPTGRRAIQTAVATGLAMLVGGAAASSHQYWAPLAAFLVLGGSETVEETFVKGTQRVIGTIVGAVIGFWMTAVTGNNPLVLLPLLAVCVFAAMYLRPISYTLMAFWITIMTAVLYELLGTLQKETLQVRVLETIIGAGIALGAAAFLLPTHTRQKLRRNVVAFLQGLERITQTCIEQLGGSTAISSLTGQALELELESRQLMKSAEPLRRGSGFLRLDGIERRLTASAALTYYARHLVRATERSTGFPASVSAAARAQLATFTRDNISALIHVLTQELPGPVHGTDNFRLQPDAPSELSNNEYKAALHYLARINQTVLALIEDLTRGTTQSAAT